MDFSALEAAFATDTDAETNGKWVDYRDGKVHIRVRVRSSESDEAVVALRKAYKRRRHLMQGDDTLAVERAVKAEAIANGYVTDWDFPGAPAYSAAAAIQVFTKLPKFMAWIERQADNEEHFRKKADEEDLGNSSTTSATATPGAPKSGKP